MLKKTQVRAGAPMDSTKGPIIKAGTEPFHTAPAALEHLKLQARSPFEFQLTATQHGQLLQMSAHALAFFTT